MFNNNRQPPENPREAEGATAHSVRGSRAKPTVSQLLAKRERLPF